MTVPVCIMHKNLIRSDSVHSIRELFRSGVYHNGQYVQPR